MTTTTHRPRPLPVLHPVVRRTLARGTTPTDLRAAARDLTRLAAHHHNHARPAQAVDLLRIGCDLIRAADLLT